MVVSAEYITAEGVRFACETLPPHDYVYRSHLKREYVSYPSPKYDILYKIASSLSFFECFTKYLTGIPPEQNLAWYKPVPTRWRWGRGGGTYLLVAFVV